VQCSLILVAGSLSDRYGRRAVYGAGVAGALVWVWLLFPMLDSKVEWIITAALVSGLCIHAFMYGPQAAFIAEHFRRRCATPAPRWPIRLPAYSRGIRAAGLHCLVPRVATPMVIALYAPAALLITALVLRFARIRASDFAGRICSDRRRESLCLALPAIAQAFMSGQSRMHRFELPRNGFEVRFGRTQQPGNLGHFAPLFSQQRARGCRPARACALRIRRSLVTPGKRRACARQNAAASADRRTSSATARRNHDVRDASPQALCRRPSHPAPPEAP
jgi:hypothetical protein